MNVNVAWPGQLHADEGLVASPLHAERETRGPCPLHARLVARGLGQLHAEWVLVGGHAWVVGCFEDRS